jgi:hypothetical protein
MITDELLLGVLLAGLIIPGLYSIYESFSVFEVILYGSTIVALLMIALPFIWSRYSKSGRKNQRRLAKLKEIPSSLLMSAATAVLLGFDQELRAKIYLPDAIRMRHVHIIGATGSGKTESVILNLLRQDVDRGFGSIILDAKGDMSFLKAIGQFVPKEKLCIFDLSSEESLTYDPLAAGSPLEAAQRLFSSFTWSEEYYKSRAFSALQRLFQLHFDLFDKNPKLTELDRYLDNPKSFSAFMQGEGYPESLAQKDFADLSGLRDQIKILCTGHLKKTLSPEALGGMNLSEAAEGKVLYFRLQSLLSPQLVSIVGKLLINHLNFLAGTAHRVESAVEKKLTPIYFDEFAAFASPEFADLISKARSAGYALHFSHQSIGDLAEVTKGFLNQITDNSATKIIFRINDPDSAEFFSRSFGTKIFQKITQRVTNVEELDRAEVVGEGTQREAHQFRAPPDLFKTLPTGTASVLIAHGYETPHGASTVFKVKFPRLSLETSSKQLIKSGA